MLQINKEDSHYSIRNQTKDMKGKFSKVETWITNEWTESNSVLIVLLGMQIETIMRYHFLLISLVNMKK